MATEMDNFFTKAKFSWKIARLKDFAINRSDNLTFEARLYDACGKSWLITVKPTEESHDKILHFKLEPEELEGPRHVICVCSINATHSTTGKLKRLTSHTISHSFKEWQVCIWESFPKLFIQQNQSLTDAGVGIIEVTLRIGCRPEDLCHFEDVDKALADRLNLLRSGVAHDTTFVVENRHFPAHRQVLVSHSEVFKRMFENKMSESVTGKVVITDAKAEVFDAFLQYLYTGAYPEKLDVHAVPLFILADKYKVKSLEKLCIAHFRTIHLDYSSAKILVPLSCKYANLKRLQGRLVDYLDKNLHFLDSNEWKEVVDESPREAIELLQLHAKRGLNVAASHQILRDSDSVSDS